MKNIPNRFIDSIKDDSSSLSVDYQNSINAYTQVYDENKLYFFEEYTNHGIDHINAILNFSNQLIPEDTFTNFIDSQNCFVLILSTFLHDIGMHHTFQSFKNLISQTSISIPELDIKSWKELWKEFVEKVNKYDAKKREMLFGDRNINITIPEFDSKDNLTGVHKKLIGEFIRIHHPRMAHEIAVNGMYSNGIQVIKPVSRERNMADLIGLIARSHGANMRELFQYIENKYTTTGALNPLSIHIWYLMCVLRIADYVQIDKNRINSIPFRMSGYTSPLSNMEHVKHLSIERVYFSSIDPETLMIIASPEDNVVFVELDELLTAIQNELDVSWAILGEKYGSQLKKPNLSLRRIKSNIQETNYKDTILDFIPERIIFEASSDLPYLLVGPLYGEDVSYGVRELIQNSIDACYMRQRIENESNYKPEINVRIIYFNGQEDKFLFEIFDNGIGMNADIIKNYFLKAGSTNRRSKEWELCFLNEDRTSSIARSGRFGIGLLSAFLIGDEISVETRKVGERYGLQFTASLTSENIKVLKKDTEFIGTKIQIPIRDNILTQFKERPKNNIVE
ncbi:MAG: ATP-binding protein [Bacteroidales bacterium]|nr:ATP-binding protein [Bacteroidales bacterium]MDD3665329.1 ATP-binding protein [Bacteroidales bacterium]